MAHLEKEFKNLLTFEQYQQLKQEYQTHFTKNIRQTNSYFDFEGKLEAARCALRIRLVDGAPNGEITLKIPQSSLEVLEITEELPREQLEWWIESQTFVLPSNLQEALITLGIDISHVYATATLTTQRLEAQLDAHHLLVLDASQYAEKQDYEIELEVDDLVQGERFFNDLLQRFDIKRQQAPSKIKRAIAATRKQNT